MFLLDHYYLIKAYTKVAGRAPITGYTSWTLHRDTASVLANEVLNSPRMFQWDQQPCQKVLT